MWRRALLFAVLGVFAVLGAVAVASPGGAQARAATADARRVFVVTVGPRSLEDWRATTFLRALMDDGASAILDTRTGVEETDSGRAQLAAIATIGAGARASTTGVGLADALARGGVPFVASIGYRATVGAPPGLRPQDAATGKLASPGVALLNLFEHVPHKEGEPLTPRNVLPYGVAFVADLRARLQPGDMLIVLSEIPTTARALAHRATSMVAVVGPGVPHGLLFSRTSAREGVVALTDIAPTVLRALGIARPASMTGEPIEFRANASPLATLERLDRDRGDSGAPWTLALIAGAVAVAIGLVLYLTRRGARGGRGGRARKQP
jgi:hypothetical protein